MFETYRCTLQEYPQTLLGSGELNDYYDDKKNEYFFDRNRESFSYILNFYQTGRLYAPSHVPPDIFEAEREFYKINLALRQQKITVQNGTKKVVSKKSKWEKLSTKVWKFLNDPKSSLAATVWAWLDIFFIMISVTCLIVETLPDVSWNFLYCITFLFHFFKNFLSSVCSLVIIESTMTRLNLSVF